MKVADDTVSTFNAGASMLGYLYQVRMALLWAIRHSRFGDFSVNLETLDDVSFESHGDPVSAPVCPRCSRQPGRLCAVSKRSRWMPRCFRTCARRCTPSAPPTGATGGVGEVGVLGLPPANHPIRRRRSLRPPGPRRWAKERISWIACWAPPDGIDVLTHADLRPAEAAMGPCDGSGQSGHTTGPLRELSTWTAQKSLPAAHNVTLRAEAPASRGVGPDRYGQRAVRVRRVPALNQCCHPVAAPAAGSV